MAAHNRPNKLTSSQSNLHKARFPATGNETQRNVVYCNATKRTAAQRWAQSINTRRKFPQRNVAQQQQRNACTVRHAIQSTQRRVQFLQRAALQALY